MTSILYLDLKNLTNSQNTIKFTFFKHWKLAVSVLRNKKLCMLADNQVFNIYLERYKMTCLPGSHLGCYSKRCPPPQNGCFFSVPCDLNWCLKIVAEAENIGCDQSYFSKYFFFFYQWISSKTFLLNVTISLMRYI